MCRIEYITLYTVIQIVLLNRSEHRVDCTRVSRYVYLYVCMCVCTCPYACMRISKTSVCVCPHTRASVCERSSGVVTLRGRFHTGARRVVYAWEEGSGEG